MDMKSFDIFPQASFRAFLEMVASLVFDQGLNVDECSCCFQGSDRKRNFPNTETVDFSSLVFSKNPLEFGRKLALRGTVR